MRFCGDEDIQGLERFRSKPVFFGLEDATEAKRIIEESAARYKSEKQ